MAAGWGEVSEDYKLDKTMVQEAENLPLLMDISECGSVYFLQSSLHVKVLKERSVAVPEMHVFIAPGLCLYMLNSV
jgi:hypothetical protein